MPSKKLRNGKYVKDVFIKYTDKFIFKTFKAQVWMIPFLPSIIIVRPEEKNNMGLLDHELTHVKQRDMDLFYIPKYFLSKNYRLNAEAAAYAVQLAHYPVKQREFYLNMYADFLHKGYFLNKWFYKTTLDECRDKIKFYLGEMRYKL